MLLTVLSCVREVFTFIMKYGYLILVCDQQAGNSHNRYAVSIVKDGAEGHLPTKTFCL